MAFDGTLKFDTAIDKAGFKLGIDSLGSIAKKGLAVVTGAVGAASAATAALGGYAISVGKDFESGMAQVIATMGKTKTSLTDDGINIYGLLEEAASKAGSETVFSASEAADALNYLALAGYDAEKAAEALPAVLNLAAAGSLDLAYASDLVTDSMAALGIEAIKDNLTHFGDMLAKTASNANASVGQLGEAILVCGGQARLAGMDVEDMCTMLGILADNGIKGAEGGTALRNLLKNMYTPTSAAADAMAALGISTAETDGTLRSTQDILLDTMSAMENLSEASKMQYMGDIFDVRTIAAASATLNNCTERYDELKGKVTDCDGAMAQMAATMNDTLEGDLKSLSSKAEAFGNAIYKNMNEPLRNAAKLGQGYLVQLTDAFNEGGFEGLAASFGDVAADAVSTIAGYVPKFADMAVSLLQSLIKGLTANAHKIAEGGVAAVKSLALGILSSAESLIGLGVVMIKEILSGIAGALPDVLEAAVSLFFTLTDGILGLLPELFPIANDILQTFVKALTDKLPHIIPQIFQLAYGIVEALTGSDLISTIIGAALPIITALADGLFAAAPIVYDLIPEIVSNIFDILSTVAPEFGRAGWELIKHLVSGVIEVAPQMFEAIGEIVMALVDGLTEYFPAVWEAAKEVLGELWGIISEHFGGFFESFGEWLYDANEGLEEWFGKIVGTVVDWLGGLWETVSEKVGGFFEGIGERLYDAHEGIKEWLGNVIGTVINWAVEMYTNAKETAENFLGCIIERVKKFPRMMWENFSKTVGKVVEFAVELREKGREAAENLVKKITDGIKDLPRKMTESGRNLVEGLWNGVTGAGDWLKSKISEFGSGIIDGFKSAFGIHSPSTVMRDRVGKFMAQGVGVGFVEEMPSVRRDAVRSVEKIIPESGAADALRINQPTMNSGFMQSVTTSQITNNYTQSTVNNTDNSPKNITLHAYLEVSEEIVAEGVTNIIADKIDDRQGVTVKLKKRGVAV